RRWRVLVAFARARTLPGPRPFAVHASSKTRQELRPQRPFGTPSGVGCERQLSSTCRIFVNAHLIDLEHTFYSPDHPQQGEERTPWKPASSCPSAATHSPNTPTTRTEVATSTAH